MNRIILSTACAALALLNSQANAQILGGGLGGGGSVFGGGNTGGGIGSAADGAVSAIALVASTSGLSSASVGFLCAKISEAMHSSAERIS